MITLLYMWLTSGITLWVDGMVYYSRYGQDKDEDNPYIIALVALAMAVVLGPLTILLCMLYDRK